LHVHRRTQKVGVSSFAPVGSRSRLLSRFPRLLPLTPRSSSAARSAMPSDGCRFHCFFDTQCVLSDLRSAPCGAAPCMETAALDAPCALNLCAFVSLSAARTTPMPVLLSKALVLLRGRSTGRLLRAETLRASGDARLFGPSISTGSCTRLATSSDSGTDCENRALCLLDSNIHLSVLLH